MKKSKNENLIEVKYLRAGELAAVMGIGLSTVWLYAKQGKLTPKKLSDRVTLFSVEEIEREFGITLNIKNIAKTQKQSKKKTTKNTSGTDYLIKKYGDIE